MVPVKTAGLSSLFRLVFEIFRMVSTAPMFVTGDYFFPVVLSMANVEVTKKKFSLCHASDATLSEGRVPSGNGRAMSRRNGELAATFLGGLLW